MITTEPHKDLMQIPHHRCPYLMNPDESLEFLHGEPQYLLDNIKHYSNERSLEIKQVSEY
jgi:putative SOS response-associated peptidase YedK